ncbi:hypothetical protein [Candidatus Methylacidithermus pantelleriae]|uniref:Uncharacterized protein n=1 Tax=Candidatus Methylacidithermus pantelleriae TaxID=2744239 RepID=A0A8J2FX63_9BACT|nr:hypothetical protein [Candidatus Methylacidithermus pantelleriae]CAF0703495.1 hypothetical protein MPNT_60015 [Candidatus Methylacidithermus pantelleriae]
MGYLVVAVVELEAEPEELGEGVELSAVPPLLPVHGLYSLGGGEVEGWEEDGLEEGAEDGSEGAEATGEVAGSGMPASRVLAGV